MRRIMRGLGTGAAGLAMLVGAACADVFQLHSGGRIVGTLIESKSGEPLLVEGKEAGKSVPAMRIKTSTGATLVLPREVVAEHVKLRPALEDYEKVKPTFPDTAEGQWALAEWCRERDLITPRKVHLARVVELDPEHEGARRGLGHVRLDGKWSNPRDVMIARGYVEYRGKWRLPQEVELMEARRKQELSEKEWFRKIGLWRDWIVNGDKRAGEAREKLLKLDDPAALRALSYHMKGEALPEIRMMYCEALGQMHRPAAHTLLMERAVADPEREIRIASVEKLARDKSTEAVAFFIKMLKNPDNKVVNYAAYALGVMKDPVAVQPLIDALVTKHKFQVTYGAGGGAGSMSNTFSTGGPGGGPSAAAANGGMGGMAMGMGSKTEVIHLPIQNIDSLAALTAITGQNFAYDLYSWKQWYAAQKKAESLDDARRN